MPPPLAVTFDFWNTLVAEDDGALRDARIERVGGILAGAGVPMDRRELEAVFERSWQGFVRAWHENRQYTAQDAVDHVVAETGAQVAPAVRDELVDAVLHAGRGAATRLTPNAGPCLRALKDAGVRLWIICDVGLTPSPVLRSYLDGHGVLGLFDHWSFSDEVGVFKPDPAIFAHAASGLGVDDPSAFAHVGDLRRTDVGGSTAAGWTTVRYRGLNDDIDESSPDAAIVVDHHGELLAALGLA